REAEHWRKLMAAEGSTEDGKPPPLSLSCESPHAPASFPVEGGGARFHVLRLLGEGGQGRIHVARDEELDREVALKEIQERYADDGKVRSRFLAEAEITGKLEHPGVVPVYELGR